MTLSGKFTHIALVAAAAACIPLSASAHRMWLLPSATSLGSEQAWVTVDAAASSDVFFPDHVPLKLDNLLITAPDGTPAKAENASTGKYRSTFDLQLAQAGTYKIGLVNNTLLASYKENGQPKRWRGTAETFARDVPANAEDLQVTQSMGRVETFVTAGKPGGKALAITGAGLEMQPVTAPTDLYAGETASFRLLLDGKPAANVKVTLISGGVRYRSKLNDMSATTGQDGKFSVIWPSAGMYWLEASIKDDKASKPAKERRASYVATLEVLPQ
ncbi:DUF4198 domain-containing protein [Undibacterium sp.]|jgi:uncharacterized GH25 family protein|uniref:DUF4198 domain-containing protein n=1 Tax=Undibacterium sp. TaxID=1914977 RepID=UPI002BB9FC80|nr:DUF4198 domain-containing protein [Undibacterium sp.]HTD04302.1 DUF4198 domain-containing protein [Undibacterium sp.]